MVTSLSDTDTAAKSGVAVHVNGVTLSVPDDASVLDAVLAAGVDLPHLCKDDDGPALAACRTCLVQIDGVRGLPASCTTPVAEGQVIRTESEAAVAARSGVLALTDAMRAPANGGNGGGNGAANQTEISRHLRSHLVDGSRWDTRARRYDDDSNPFYRFDAADCILCGRCVSACSDRQHIGAIGIAGSGHDARIAAFGDEPLGESTCTSCGSCVAACPTDALTPKRGAEAPAPTTVSTTCPYCGVGCGIRVTARDGQITHVDDDPDNQSSLGLLCVKGRFGTSFVNHPDRLTTPLVRRAGKLEPTDWETALNLAAEKFAEHQGAFGTFSSAKATNEDNYLQQKFVRAVMGTNNIDHCTRLCHSPSVEAMLAQLGSGATSNSYSDYEQADCLFVVGADPSSNHPVAASRMRSAVVERGARLIVLNPKRIEMCDHTDLWLRQYPGTDVAVLNGMARVILDEGLADDDFIARRTEGYEEWRAELDQYTPEFVEGVSGVPADLLRRAARVYARPRPQGDDPGGSCLIWGMGVTQHTNGTANATALLNLALLTGQVGRVGNGVSPLRGQNNVQGAGDAGCIPDALPGYQRYTPDVLSRFNAAWQAQLPADEGMRATDMVESILSDGLKCMYIVGENPLLTEPNLAHAREAFEQLDFLVVQDIFLHETAELADIVLPAASFAEKEGTFTNSERRVQRVRRVIDAVGEARPDWQIVQDLARRTAAQLGVNAAGFDHPDAASVFDEMASLTPMLGGLSHARLDRQGGIQWPCPEPDHPGTERLYGVDFPRGKGRFVPVRQTAPSEEAPDERYPFILNTGRVLYHWHGGTITRRVEGLVEAWPELRAAVHPQDAARLEIESGEAVSIASRRGKIEAVAFVTRDVAPGSVFIPFVRLQESAANWLTHNVYDEQARIPEYKVCAVSLERPAAPGEWRRDRRRGKSRQYW